MFGLFTTKGFNHYVKAAQRVLKAQTRFETLDSIAFCALHQGNCFTIPNYDTQKEGFDRSNYWRGQVWININWMLAQGLRRYGYTAKADSLQKDLVQLPIRFGFHEYFDSFDGIGYGSKNFSWTAALFIDLVNEFYESEKSEGSVTRKIKGLFAGETILNDGGEMPEIDPDKLAGELMQTIRMLRDKFYDTNRGLVDYDRLRDSSEFQHYRILANGLREFKPSCLMGRKAKLAFWTNLYNTIVVDAIVTLRVKQSVREVPEFFRKVKYAIGSHLFSADDIEHGILRGNVRPWFYPMRPFGPRDQRRALILTPVDPRIHFALVCGSRSCAPIGYYDVEHIYEQLEEAAKSFVNSSEVLVLPEEGKMLISEIFRWYEKDFGGKGGVIDFIFDYLVGENARHFIRENSLNLPIEYLQYDWNLNR